MVAAINLTSGLLLLRLIYYHHWFDSDTMHSQAGEQPFHFLNTAAHASQSPYHTVTGFANQPIVESSDRFSDSNLLDGSHMGQGQYSYSDNQPGPSESVSFSNNNFTNASSNLHGVHTGGQQSRPLLMINF